MNLRPRAVDFDKVWNGLRESVESIISLKKIPRRTWDDNFSDIYFLCVSFPESHSRKLYFALKECLENHTRGVMRRLSGTSNEELLREYNKEWHKFHMGAVYLQSLFLYLNKQLIKEKLDAESQHTFVTDESPSEFPHKGVGELAVGIWKAELITPLANQLVSFLIESIERDRYAPGMDVREVRDVVHSFVDVNKTFNDSSLFEHSKSSFVFSNCPSPTEFYEEIFETPFLEATANYYRSLTRETFAHLDCSAYMDEVIQKTNEERDRAIRFLYLTSVPKIEGMCSEYLVNAELERFSSVCREIVQGERIHDLRNMHILLKPLSNGLPLLIREFELYVRKSGMDSMSAAGNEPAQFVSSIQSLHEKFTRMVLDVFNEDGEFVSALDRALQSVVNHREDPKQPPKISERLNRYIDSLLRIKKGKTEADIEALLTKSIVIFRYIDDKDLFQKYYSKMLSNRLIAGLSFSMEMEESMIAKMKEACGYEFTNKFSRMYTDVGISQSLTKRFTEDLAQKNEKLEVPIQVMVLQAGAWPLSAAPNSGEPSSSSQHQENLALSNYAPPMILQDSLRHFEEFYCTSHNGRKLSWLFNNSMADVQLNYLDRQYVVTMSVYQLSVLLAFSSVDSITVMDLLAQCSLPLQAIIKCSKGLLDAGIMTTDEKGNLDESSVLTLNTNFASKRIHFKVFLPQSNKTQEKEVEATCNTLQQDRKYYMECTIVRIMKSRKVMKHNALIDEVIKQSQTRFTPDVQFIKKNVEALIDKLYIQRTDQNDEYEYIS